MFYTFTSEYSFLISASRAILRCFKNKRHIIEPAVVNYKRKCLFPRNPVPMFSCLSTLVPKSFFVSLRCIPLNSVIRWFCQISQMSHESFRSFYIISWGIGMAVSILHQLWLIFHPVIMNLICSKVWPCWYPARGIFITAVTPFVLSSEMLIDSAILERHSSCNLIKVAPGWN